MHSAMHRRSLKCVIFPADGVKMCTTHSKIQRTKQKSASAERTVSETEALVYLGVYTCCWNLQQYKWKPELVRHTCRFTSYPSRPVFPLTLLLCSVWLVGSEGLNPHWFTMTPITGGRKFCSGINKYLNILFYPFHVCLSLALVARCALVSCNGSYPCSDPETTPQIKHCLSVHPL